MTDARRISGRHVAGRRSRTANSVRAVNRRFQGHVRRILCFTNAGERHGSSNQGDRARYLRRREEGISPKGHYRITIVDDLVHDILRDGNGDAGSSNRCLTHDNRESYRYSAYAGTLVAYSGRGNEGSEDRDNIEHGYDASIRPTRHSRFRHAASGGANFRVPGGSARRNAHS